jgi:hypothetical protein
MSTAEQHLAIITGLADYFGAELSQPTLRLYLDGLSAVPPGVLEAAARKCVATKTFMPKVAELLDAAGMGERALNDRAELAWGEAWRAVASEGSYASVIFIDPVSARVIDVMGGWPAFCRPTQPDEWHRRQFLDSYRAHAGAEIDPAPVRLAGVHELQSGRVPRHVAVIGKPRDTKALPSGERTDADIMAEIQRRVGAADVAQARKHLAGKG